ncbi:MAG TPA: penicillin-binding transpeptidase domain-containing protein [Bacillales bacterium]|nr:penicillin-binding transpeptidase domain-containing protein [Bacillales bacterium]
MKKIIVAVLALVMLTVGCSKEATPQDRFSDYITLWNKQKFAKMYDYLSTDAKKSISRDEFVDRYKKIYEDLQIKDLKIQYKKPKEDKQAKEDKAVYTFHAKMNSIAGEIAFTQKATLKKQKKDKQNNWYIDWDTTYIFPQLKQGDKISLSTTAPARGAILDRNGNAMAENGQVYEVGVIPEKMDDQAVQQLSTLLKMSPDQINKAITASWVKPGYFVPLKKVSMDDQATIAELIKLVPVQTKKVEARIYPYKEAAAHLIGYVGPITADELANLKDKGYTSQDVIGKRGLEQVYDEELKGNSGVKIVIKKSDGGEDILAEQTVQDGKDMKLTIDADLQEKIFANLNGEAGTSAAMNPISGETLALVSSPSFDPNQATLGFSSDEWKALQENPQQPLTTRFKQSYAPGSVMKPITASIALENKAITPSESIQIKGPKWQKDSSWGNYFVTRVHESNPVNLEKALVLSDNIYFAQTALKLGKEPFTAGLKKYGFEKEMNYPFPLETATMGKMDKDIALADSGYGQGQIQMTIVHLMSAYTPFVNNGNMINPILLMDDKVSKDQVISSETAGTISPILRKIVSDPSGTAHAAEMSDYPLSGKTGTAELKEKQGESGKENGWFIAYNTNNPSIMIAMMIENVQKRGGSQIPVKLVKNIYTEIK